MLRVLLALLKPLASIAQSTLRIADALDRAWPKRTSVISSTYVPYDPEAFDEEVARREAFEQRRGRPLADHEELPGSFDHKDRLAGVRAFLGFDDNNRAD
jgi:hypothetical protein